MTSKRIALAWLSGASVLALSSAAWAQAASAPADNEVVVTGSRVIANGNNSPTPVTVMSTQQLLDVQPTTVADALNDLPAFVGSRSQTTTQGNSGGATGSNYLSLRNLGDTRTLILYDGHRMAPTSPTGDVDVNEIPQLLLQRVDVVTGGASAVYGSDAVTGVVNFITDTKFNGIKVNARDGISQYGDDKTVDVSFALGHSFLGGKAHLEFSYEYLDDPGIFNKNNRPWVQEVYGLTGAGTLANPYALISNERLSNSSFGGVITSGKFSGAEFSQNGIATPFVNGIATGTAGDQEGGDGAYYYTASLKAMLVTHQLFMRGDYDFTDNIHGYAQVFGTFNHTSDLHQMNEVRGTTNFGVLGYNNAFLQSVSYGGTPLYNAACTTGTAACTFAYGKMMMQAPTFQPDTYENSYSLITGLDGAIANYKWSLGYVHTYTVQKTSNDANLNGGHLLAAENSVIGPNGTPVCHAALVNPAYANCVPLNLFGPTSESQAALNYILAVTTYWARTQYDDTTGSFSGAPFSTWAGPVNMAVSGEWRNLRYNLISNAQPGDQVDCNGIQFGCFNSAGAPQPLWVTNTLSNRSPVSQSVYEFAYETDIPLVKDVPFIQSFDLNGAVRYTNYSNSGGVVTWKIGADWHVNDQLTVRATRSRDIRAPNLNELYAPLGFSPNGYTDLHTGNIQQQLNQYSQGNPNLTPEVADTTTAGFVYKPSFIPRFSLAVDAYRIVLNNAIINLSGGSKNVQSACEASGGTSVYCSLVVRPLPFSNTTAANFPLESFTTNLNVAYIDTYGADFEANYALNVFDHATTYRLLASYQPHQVYNLGPGGIVDMGDASSGQGNPDPGWKLTGLANVNVTDKLKVDVIETWHNSMKMTGLQSTYFIQQSVGAEAYTSLNVSYDLNTSVGQTQLFLNINNLFNTQPIPYATSGNGTVPGLQGGFLLGDDPIGRYFTIGLHFKH